MSASDQSDAAPTTTERGWQHLAGIDPDTSKFPARTKVDDEGIIVFRTKDGYRGVQRNCPHMQATLIDAELVSNDTMVRCAQHIFTFKLSDGKGVNCPGFRLTIYEIKREQDGLYGRRVG